MSDPIQALLNLDAADQDRIESLLIRVANGSASGAEHRQFERNMLRLSNMTTENQQGNEKGNLAPKLHPYADHPAAIPPPDMPSRLLSMPKEIRLEIYRYLLLPTVYVSIEPETPDDRSSFTGDSYSGNSDWTDWTDEVSTTFHTHEPGTGMQITGDITLSLGDFSDDFQTYFQDQVEEAMRNDPDFPSDYEAEIILDEADQLIPPPNYTQVVDLEGGGTARRSNRDAKWETESNEPNAETYRMFPEILRVNKQIHEEASALLFTEGTVVIDANDLFWLTNKHMKYGGKFGKTPWRYNPLTATAKRLPGGAIQYDGPKSTGLMEPHIFAKFQKVLLDCTLEEEYTQGLEFFMDIETWKLDYEHADKFRKYLRTLPFIRDFVRLLSKSQLINKLSVNVLVEISAESKLDAESVAEDDEEAIGKLDEMQERVEVEANIRATEIFMDADMFTPFKKLKNVRRLEFGYGFEDYIPAVKYEPEQKYIDILRELKTMVEGNFREPEEPTRAGLRSQGSVGGRLF